MDNEELKHEYPHLSDKLRKLYDDVKRLWFREYVEFTTFGEYFSSTNTIVI